jgi:uncharacterized membrane protein
VSLDLAIAHYNGEGTAVEVFAAAKGAAPSARWLAEVGFVEHHPSGRLLLRGTFAGHYLDVDESDRVSEKGAGAGAIAGGLIGALLGPAGIAVGLVAGGALGSRVSTASTGEAEPAALAEQLRAAVPASSSALVLIAQADDVTDMLTSVGESAESVIRQSLSGEQAAELEASLSAAPKVPPPS